MVFMHNSFIIKLIKLNIFFSRAHFFLNKYLSKIDI